MTGARQWLRKAGESGLFDLAEAGLQLSSLDRPSISLDPYRRHLDKLADDVAEYAGGAADDLPMRCEALRQVLAKRHGYGGDDEGWEDLDGASLMRVIDLRHGLPAVLAILYLHVAERLGWPMEALDFPARVLVRLELDGERAILDPFGGARMLETPDLRDLLKALEGLGAELAPDHFRVLGRRDLLVRTQDILKTRALRGGRLEEALYRLETLLLIAPGEARAWKELGLLLARLERNDEAVEALGRFLALTTGDASRFKASHLLQELQAKLR